MSDLDDTEFLLMLEGSPEKVRWRDGGQGRMEKEREDKDNEDGGIASSSICSTPEYMVPVLPSLSSSAHTLRSCISAYSTHVGTPSSSISSHNPFLPNPSRKSVTFSPSPETFQTLSNEEYDRSPHPVVVRLSYRDVLELREMKVELGIVMRRQQMEGVDGGVKKEGEAEGEAPGEGKVDNENRKRTALVNNTLRLDLQHGDRPTTTIMNPAQHHVYSYKPPSPSVFPSSPFLVSQLQRLPLPYPPARATGVGMAVQPTFDMDGLNSPTTSGHPFARGRLQPSRNFSGHSTTTTTTTSTSSSRSRLVRKTSSDSINSSSHCSNFGQIDDDEESEFQRELRQAREELDMLAVKEMRDKEMVGRGRTMETREPPMRVGDRPGRLSSSSSSSSSVEVSTKADRSMSRSAAFFETTIQPLRPPGRAGVDVDIGDGSRFRFGSGNSLSPSPSMSKSHQPELPTTAQSHDITALTITSPTPIQSPSPVAIGSIVERRTPPLSFHLSTPSTSVGLPLHSPLPERDPSPVITLDEQSIETPAPPPAGGNLNTSDATPLKHTSNKSRLHPTISSPRHDDSASTPPAVTPRAIRPPQIIPTRSSFFDAHSPIKAPFARSTPGIEVSR